MRDLRKGMIPPKRIVGGERYTDPVAWSFLLQLDAHVGGSSTADYREDQQRERAVCPSSSLWYRWNWMCFASLER